MIEPWEDPWASAAPAGPRRNGTKGNEADTGDSLAERTPRRWSRSSSEPADGTASRRARPTRSAPEDQIGGDDRSAAEARTEEARPSAVSDRAAPPRHASPPSVPIDKLARWALPLALDTSDHLDLSGHRSTVQDLLEADPPSIRFLLWPRRGPLDTSDGPRRHTLELVLERDAGDLFVARHWADDRRREASLQGRAAAPDADRDWFDRQLVHFVERVLSLA